MKFFAMWPSLMYDAKRYMHLLLISILLALSPPLWADIKNSLSFSVSNRCPNNNPEYEKVLQSLSSFKLQLADAKKCPALTDRIDELHKIVGSDARKKVKDIFDGLKGKELSVGQVKDVKDYAEKVSTTVLDILNMVNDGDQNCIEDAKKTSLLNSLASATEEITGFVAEVSGPYSVPISIGGGIFAGIVKGIDSYFEKTGIFASSDYNFANSEHRELFVKNFCIYNEIISDVDYLTKPRENIAALDLIAFGA